MIGAFFLIKKISLDTKIKKIKSTQKFKSIPFHQSSQVDGPCLESIIY